MKESIVMHKDFFENISSVHVAISKKKRIFGEAGSMTRTFFTGFAFGGLIGAGMGTLMGTVAAW